MRLCCVKTCIGQLVFGIILSFASVCLLVSLVAPGWSGVNAQNTYPNGSINYEGNIKIGLFYTSCTNKRGDYVECGKYKFDSSKREWHEWIVVIFMMLSLLLSSFAEIWNVIVCFSCFGKVCGLAVLEVITCITPCMISTALLVDGIWGKDRYVEVKRDTKFIDTVGYAYWFAFAAALIICIDSYVLGYVINCARSENKEEEEEAAEKLAARKHKSRRNSSRRRH